MASVPVEPECALPLSVGWSRGDSVGRVHQWRYGRVNGPVRPLEITYKHCKKLYCRIYRMLLAKKLPIKSCKNDVNCCKMENSPKWRYADTEETNC